MSRLLALERMANVHSHAFQRGLRGIAQRPTPPGVEGDDFWGWRESMYELAASLDPDGMRALAARAYAEMAAAGYGSVGEFHYVHHQPDGAPYPEPNEMAIAVAEAAVAAGLEIVLLPAAYHRAGWSGADLPPSPGQQRFCDAHVEDFLERVEALRGWAEGRVGVSVGIAAHSVRAVPASWLEAIADFSRERSMVRHVHSHEQPRELEECQAEHGCSPIELLSRTGFLDGNTTVVHAIHVSEADIALLAEAGATVASCPTTEGDLGDGCFPALRYLQAGVMIAIGSDSQVVIDPFLEVRELETLARREGLTRAALLADDGDLWTRLARAGRHSLGLSGPAGEVLVDLNHPQLAGVAEEDARLAIATGATAAVVAGRQ